MRIRKRKDFLTRRHAEESEFALSLIAIGLEALEAGAPAPTPAAVHSTVRHYGDKRAPFASRALRIELNVPEAMNDRLGIVAAARGITVEQALLLAFAMGEA